MTWGPPGGLLEVLKTIHVSGIVAWGDFWVLLGPQRAPKAPPRILVGASWGLLGSFLGLSWFPFVAPATSRASKSDVKSLLDANLSSHLVFGSRKINDLHGFSQGFVNIYVG